MTIALAVIAKDETREIKRIINDYGHLFDEVAISIDDSKCLETIKRECKHKDLKLVSYKWINDFSDKRNDLAKHIDSEYYFRLDTDDTIGINGSIKDLFEKIERTKPDVVYCKYIYSKDEDGNVIAEHWRETIIRKSDNHYWNKKIHENIFVEDRSIYKGVKDNNITIIHNPEPGHALKSFDRNMEYLLEEYHNDGDNTDPRTIAYLGRMMMGKGEWVNAIGFLQLLVKKSGWDDDKYFAYTELAFCHMQLGEYDNGIAACYEALSINPEYPDSYICLGEIYLNKKDFHKANTWLLHANTKKLPDTMYIIDPSRYSIRLACDLAMSYYGIGEFEKAKMFFDRAKKISPSNGFVLQNENLIEEGYEQDKYIKNLLWMLMYTKKNDDTKVKDLVSSIPKNIIVDERVQRIRHDVLPSKRWSENSVVIFCGQSWEDWADPSVTCGLGGSEEAVVYLSRELVNRGYEVTVYNSCGDLEGEYNGVHYKPFYYFNKRDMFNILVAWRGNIFSQYQFSARKKYIWKHDVPQPDQYNEKELDCFDKIIVQSRYHRSLFPEYIPDDKFFVTRNGINLPDFKPLNVGRKPFRMIYTSSYDRGIQHLLIRWKEVREAIPEAELHLFYGWDVYDAMVDKGYRSKDFKEKMVKLMDQEGVFENGRVGHKQLNKEMQRSNTWVYPCHFEEISCIAAMKAQANGCVPIVVNYAALKETVKHGITVDGKADNKETMDRYIDVLIKNMKDHEMMEDLRSHVVENKEQFGWDIVANEWDSEFKS